jgi:hypothetical protein
LCEFGARDLGILPHSCLAEDGPQDRGAVGGEPVRDAYGSTVEGRAQLPDSVAEAAGVGLAERGGVFREQPDVFVDFEEVLGRQGRPRAAGLRRSTYPLPQA